MNIEDIPIAKPAAGMVTCGHCGATVRRLGENESVDHPGIPKICSRTLVNGLFLASCSEPCNLALQVQAGTVGRQRKKSIRPSWKERRASA